MTTSPTDRQVADPLSATTRLERRALLIMNVVIAAMAYGGVIPSEIQSLGLKAVHLNEGVLLAIAYFMAMYFLVAFGMYASTDIKAWRIEMFDLHDQHQHRTAQMFRDSGRELVKEQIRRVASALPEEELDRITTAVLESVSNTDSDLPVWRAFPKFWHRYSRPYRFRMLFDVYFPLVLSILNLIGALVWRVAK